MMSFQVKHRFLLVICGFALLGVNGCEQQVEIETSAPAEVITEAAPAEVITEAAHAEAECTKAEEKEEVPVATAGPKVAFEPWYALGPFYNITFEQVIGPENGPDLTREYEQDTPFKYKWKRHPEWEDGKGLDLRLPANSSMYFYRIAKASQAGKIKFTVGTGDGLQVWVNGDEVFKRFEVGNANTEKISANLHRGSNTILLKVYNQDSASELYFEK
ncbi:MAG: hypothetical protein DRP65_03790 [Planctomycetota bacterium]|nr:MAG: hypothetical protein DRP65_03790 [Planctomycetota bacterium]